MSTDALANPDLTAIFDAVEFRDAYRISYITNAILVPSYDAIKRDFGLIRAEYLLLLCLAHYPVLSAKDVAKMTRRPRNSISRAVHRMLAVGYIQRAPDPDDGRQAKLTITLDGRTLHTQIAEVLRARQQTVFEPLNDSERTALDALLTKLAVHASTLDT